MFEFTSQHAGTVRGYVEEATRCKDTELEIRFSTFFKANETFPQDILASEHQRPDAYRFTPFIDKATFYRMLTTFAARFPNQSFVESIDTFYPESIRHTQVLTPGSADAWIKKTKTKFTDIWQANLRVALSSEQRILPLMDQRLRATSKRHKMRHSFHQDGLGIRHDFTIVKYTNLLRGADDNKECFEIELEMVPCNIPREEQTRHLLDWSMFTLRELQDAPLVMTLSERHNLNLEYALLLSRSGGTRNHPSSTQAPLGKPRFIGAQPESLHQHHLARIKSGYSLTEKYDGERALVFINNTGQCFLFDRRMRARCTGVFCMTHRGSILDAEVINDGIHAFDVLFHHGNDLRDNKAYCLVERINLLQDIVTASGRPNNLNGAFSLHLKPHYFDDFDDVFGRWASARADGIPRDGFIFTPVDEPYPSKIKWLSLLKWKPMEINSIDFLVRHPRPIASTGLAFDVFVGGKDDKPTPFTESPLMILIPNEDGFVEADLTSSVVECVWDEARNAFRPLRIRDDKNRPNFQDIALDVWKNIKMPVSLADLMRQPFEGMRKLHNFIKRYLIEKAVALVDADRHGSESSRATNWGDMVSEEDSDGSLIVMDLASGRGGDLHKWTSLAGRVDKNIRVIAVDINEAFLSEAKRRYQLAAGKGDKRMEMEFYQADLRTQVFRPLCAPVQVVSCQFAMHYFFESHETFSTVLRTISDNLCDGGIFVCSLFDGQEVVEYLKRVGQEAKEFVVTPQFEMRMGIALLRERIFGNAISVSLNGSDVILNRPTTEYLVFADLFIHQMQLKGFDLVECHLFRDWKAPEEMASEVNNLSLTAAEMIYSDLHRYYVFRKDPERKRVPADVDSKTSHLRLKTWREEFTSSIRSTGRAITGFQEVDAFELLGLVALISSKPPLSDLELDSFLSAFARDADGAQFFGRLSNRMYVAFGVFHDFLSEYGEDYHKPETYLEDIPTMYIAIENGSIRVFAHGNNPASVIFNLPPGECPDFFGSSGKEKEKETLDEDGLSTGISELHLATGNEIPSSSTDPPETGDDAPESDTFEGKSIGRGKGSWTIKALRDYAKEKGVDIPSSVSRKEEIVSFLRAHAM